MGVETKYSRFNLKFHKDLPKEQFIKQLTVIFNCGDNIVLGLVATSNNNVVYRIEDRWQHMMTQASHSTYVTGIDTEKVNH